MNKEEILEKAKRSYMELAGKLTGEEIEPFGRLIGFVQSMPEEYKGETIPTNKLTFTLNYGNGTKKHVERGVLFSIGEDDTMYIHIGVETDWELFGTVLCLTDFIDRCGMTERFKNYIDNMVKKKGW